MRNNIQKIVDKTKETFMCPLCKREVHIGKWGASLWPDEPMGVGSPRKDRQSNRNMEYRLSNKRYHMRLHKESKKGLTKSSDGTA